MRNNDSLSVFGRQFLLWALSIMAMTLFIGCPQVIAVPDVPESNLVVTDPAAPTVSVVDHAGTGRVVTWTWESNGEVGDDPAVFRWRLNQGAWVGPVSYTTLTPFPEHETSTNAEVSYAGHPGTPRTDRNNLKVLADGRYRFEVQARDATGSWSAVSFVEHETSVASGHAFDSNLVAHFAFNGSFADTRGSWRATPGPHEGLGPALESTEPSPAGGSYLRLRNTVDVENPNPTDVQYLSVRDSGGGRVNLGESFTVSFWYRPALDPVTQEPYGMGTLIAFGDFDSPEEFPLQGGWALTGQLAPAETDSGMENAVLFWLFPDPNSYAEVPEMLPPWAEGVELINELHWTHVALTADAGTRRVELYLNGERVGATALFFELPVYNGPLTIGALGSVATDYGAFGFNGDIDDLRVYDTPLTTVQVNALRGPGFAAPQPVLSEAVRAAAIPIQIPQEPEPLVVLPQAFTAPGERQLFTVSTDEIGMLDVNGSSFETGSLQATVRLFDANGYEIPGMGSYEHSFGVYFLAWPDTYYIQVQHDAATPHGPYELEFGFFPLWMMQQEERN